MNKTFDLSKYIAIGADHAGFDYKQIIIDHLNKKGLSVSDKGTYSADSVDYPDFAHPVAESVVSGETAFGILLCGSAIGVCVTANKHAGIRAALCWQKDIAELSRRHNNANIICLPSRFVSVHYAIEMIETFMETAFEAGRHENRVNKVDCK
jgi:ribose 5-phosphate isomerase B